MLHFRIAWEISKGFFFGRTNYLHLWGGSEIMHEIVSMYEISVDTCYIHHDRINIFSFFGSIPRIRNWLL